MSKRFPRDVDSLIPLQREANLSPEDTEIAALFAEPLPPLSEISAARIRRRLEAPAAAHARSVPIWFKWAVGVAAALFLLETATAAAISTWPALKQRFWSTVAAQIPASTRRQLLAEREPSSSLPSQEAANESGAMPPAPVASVAPAPTPASPPRAPRHSPRALPPDKITVPSSAEAEIALYSHALSQLNVEHDPAAALGTLGVYAFKYPNGILRKESTLAQVHAEVLLGLDAQALGLLDAMNDQAFAGFPKGSEARLLRADLLVRARRCQEALPALEPYLEPSAVPAQRGQALFLRASCRSQMNDVERSRDDLRTYLREFPSGPLAPRAAELLRSSP